MIKIHITRSFKDIKFGSTKLKELIKGVCREYGVSNAQISVVIVDDTEIRKLNSRFCNRRAITDCLSFDLSDDKSPDGRRVFEIIVNGQKAISEANSRNHLNQAELALYVTHGLLHNLGFDDASTKLAKKMHEAEDEILQQFGYGIVYNT